MNNLRGPNPDLGTDPSAQSGHKEWRVGRIALVVGVSSIDRPDFTKCVPHPAAFTNYGSKCTAHGSEPRARMLLEQQRRI